MIREDGCLDNGEVPGPSAHGGILVQRMAGDDLRRHWLEEAGRLPVIQLEQGSLSDLECLGTGAFSPLEGFMVRADYESVLKQMRLASGLAWTLPVTLPVTDGQLESIQESESVVLSGSGPEPLAILHIEEIFEYDRRAQARHVYRTEDPAHPGVASLMGQGDHLVGGKVTLLNLPHGRLFPDRRMSPLAVRREFARREWRTVAGYHTSAPLHRAQEYLTKCALEVTDGLLLHPAIPDTKGEDIPPAARMDAYETLLEHFYPARRVVLSIFPYRMRFAGPREAVFHALCRKNYGCTHFIVGRDHAGVGSFYGSFEAHEIFREFTPQELGITPLLFDHAFWCRLCGQLGTSKTCPHTPEERVALSGTEVRRRLAAGESIPQEFSRPQVVEVLRPAVLGDVRGSQ